MVYYNQYDFSTYIEGWENFVGENTPDDEEVWEIAKESEDCPVFENIYQELLLMRVEDKIVSDAAKKAIEYLKNYNSNAEEKISIPECWGVQSKIEEELEINWYVNARDTHLNVKMVVLKSFVKKVINIIVIMKKEKIFLLIVHKILKT